MYAFIHIPKTAGSTLRHMLRCGFGAQHCDIRAPRSKRRDPTLMIEPRDVQRIRRIYPRLAGICGHRVTACHHLETVDPDLKFFTVLREPIARYMSHFSHWARDRNLRGTPEELDHFSDLDLYTNVQARLIGGTDDANDSIRQIENLNIFVGLTERFPETIAQLYCFLGDPRFPTHYESKNTGKATSSTDLKEHPGLREKIHQVNQADLALYRYVTETLFPLQQKAYSGPRPEHRDFTPLIEPTWARIKRNTLYKVAQYLRLV